MPDDLTITRERASDAAATFNPRAWSSSELLASILDGVADGIAAHDASGRLLFINDAGARACGYRSAEQALAAPPDDFAARVAAFDADGVALRESELPGPMAARGCVVPERVIRLRQRATGIERWISVKASPILDERGHVRMSISIHRDVTRERLAEEEHRRAAEMHRASLEAITAKADALRAQIDELRMLAFNAARPLAASEARAG